MNASVLLHWIRQRLSPPLRRASAHATPISPTCRPRGWWQRLRQFVRFLQLGVVATTVPLSLAAREVYVFGDSAVDMGNYHALPDHAAGPNAPYYTGADGFTRLCDGPMWPELLYPGLRVYADPQRTGNLVNYAYGDAKTDDGCQEFGSALPIGVQSQLEWFAAELAAGRVHVSPQTYAFIEAGPNDYFESFTNGTDIKETGGRVAANLSGAAQRLAQAGIRTVFVHDIPDFGDAPVFYHLPDAPPELAAAFRQQLNAAAADGRAQLRAALLETRARLGGGVNLVTMPVNELFTAMRRNPAAFGFTSVTDSIYDDQSDTLLVTNPSDRSRHAFVDSLHLSASGQQWESRYYRAVIDAVEGVPQQNVARLADAAVAAGASFRRALVAGRPAVGDGGNVTSEGRWRWFAETGAEGRDGDSGRNEPAWRADSGSLIAGTEFVGAPDWRAGVALGGYGQHGHTEARALRFDASSVGGWLFGSREIGGFELHAAAGAHWLDYRLKRDPHIPTMLARAEPNGAVATAEFELRRLLRRGRFAVEMFGHAEATHFRLDGFEETGAPGLNLRYSPVRRDSGTAGLGLRSRLPVFALGRVRLEPKFWWELSHALGEGHTTVEAVLIDNTANPATGRISNGGPWRASGGLGLTATLGRHHRVDLAYENTYGSDDFSVNAVRFNYRFAF